MTATAPSQVPLDAVADTCIDVAWTGPDGEGDYIVIVEAGASGNFGYRAATRKGNPARVGAPLNPGAYELRYVHGGSERTLATRSITVVAE